MRAFLIIISCWLCAVPAFSQAFPGLAGMDNAAVLIKDNPAFAIIEDRAHVNFCNAGAYVGGNSLDFKTNTLGFLHSGSALPGTNYTKTEHSGDKSFNGSLEIAGPGIVFRPKRKYFFGVTTGLRYLVNSDHLNNDVFNLLGVNATNKQPADTFSIRNYSATAQVFEELNLSYAGFLYEREQYKLVAGATLKILNGVGAAGVGISSANFTTQNNDGIAHNLSGAANIAFTPYANKWLITNDPFNALHSPTSNLSVGADIGMIYYMNPNSAMTLKRGYKNRLAISITDIGSITYTQSSTSGSFVVNNKNVNYRNISNMPGTTFGNILFNNYLVDSVASPGSGSKKFKVNLPTALHVNGDFKIYETLFLNANVLYNLRSLSPNAYGSHYISTVTVAPRYLYRSLAFALPLSFNEYKQFGAGALVYAGPFYIGSGDIFQVLFAGKSNSLNLYTGLSVKIKPRRQSYKEMMMM